VPLKYEKVNGALVGLPGRWASAIAIYSEQPAGHAPLAPEVQHFLAARCRIQRAMDRSLRSSNP